MNQVSQNANLKAELMIYNGEAQLMEVSGDNLNNTLKMDDYLGRLYKVDLENASKYDNYNLVVKAHGSDLHATLIVTGESNVEIVQDGVEKIVNA